MLARRLTTLGRGGQLQSSSLLLQRPVSIIRKSIVGNAQRHAQQRPFMSGFRERMTHEKGTGGMSKVKLSALAAFAMSAITIGIVTYTVFDYYDFLNKYMHNFPEPVSKELRKAIFHQRQKEPKDAVECYRRALEIAAEVGMNPLSDEITGVKIQLAGLLGQNGRKDREIEIYWSVWNELMEASKVFDNVERLRLAKRAVAIGVKLGELFKNSGMRKREEDVLTRSVELMLREFGEHGATTVPKAENGEPLPQYILTNEEVGGALESLAHFYESTDKPALATPLFLRALSLCDPKSCHTVSLMSNLANCLAVHPAAGQPREEFLANATQWALKALEVDNSIKPPVRTPECDEACVVATFNLGAIAAIRGDKEEARRRYYEARSLSEALELVDSTRKIDRAISDLKKSK